MKDIIYFLLCRICSPSSTVISVSYTHLDVYKRQRSYRAPESQEVVRVDFHDTDPLPYEQPLNVIPVATERNNLSVAEPMKLSVGSFHLTIPNGTDPQLLAQTLRIVKELEC